MRGQLVLAQVAVEEKSNEITAIPLLLQQLALSGCIVTIDAMGAQKQIARQIVDDGGDYVLALKGNQGTLAKEVRETFTIAQADHFHQIQHQFYQTVDKGHGRLEIRKHWIIDDPEYIAYLNPKGKWKGLRSIGMVLSERRIGEQVTQETRYYLLSFARKVETFAQAVRSHWGIEVKQKK